MARSRSKTRKTPSRSSSRRRASSPKDGPHWGVMSVPGHQDDGSDTWWYLHYGRTNRTEEVGRGVSSMQRAGREANRRNEQARARMRRARAA